MRTCIALAHKRHNLLGSNTIYMCLRLYHIIAISEIENTTVQLTALAVSKDSLSTVEPGRLCQWQPETRTRDVTQLEEDLP